MELRWIPVLLVLGSLLLCQTFRFAKDKHIFLYFQETVVEKNQKYVGLHLNNGRMGNQLFHLITGYGIARTLGRTHYIPQETYRGHVMKYLKLFKKVFPQLQHTYALAQPGINQTVVNFAGSCCAYEDPTRLQNHTMQYLLLNFTYGQHPKYFVPYLKEVRQLLTFSSDMQKEGRSIVDAKQMPHGEMLCIHVRMGDFVELKVSTNLKRTVRAANDIALHMRITSFMVFGDDQQFMRRLQKAIADKGFSKDAIYISQYREEVDLYLASVACRAFLITAPTSTFGWWLAFFVPNQNAVFFANDGRIQNGKVPREDLFLKNHLIDDRKPSVGSRRHCMARFRMLYSPKRQANEAVEIACHIRDNCNGDHCHYEKYQASFEQRMASGLGKLFRHAQNNDVAIEGFSEQLQRFMGCSRGNET